MGFQRLGTGFIGGPMGFQRLGITFCRKSNGVPAAWNCFIKEVQ